MPQADGSLIYSQHLRREFERRAGRNAAYSLRSFARSLGVSHALLSLVMNGKRRLSPQMRRQLAGKLRLSRVELAHWLDGDANVPASGFARVDLETFALISEWQHYAILSLLETEGAQSDPRWIARRLGISEMLARVSLERLKRIGFLGPGKNGQLRQARPDITVENTVSTLASRKFHRQLLKKAAESLERDPMPQRDLSSITFAMDPAHVGLAVEEIRKFRRRLCRKLEALGSPKEVYNLTVQLFPVSRPLPAPAAAAQVRSDSERSSRESE